MKRLFALIALLALAAPALAAPRAISAEYQITMEGVLIGRVTESFERTGDTYSIRSLTRPEGAAKLVLGEQMTLQSNGKVGREGLRPLEFEQRRTGNTTRDVHASFDWDKRVMVSQYRGERHEIPLPDDTQDRISVMYQFMNLTPRAQKVDLHMANGRKVERYSYRFVDEARVATPAGEFETLHYERVTANDRERRTQVWLARDRFNFPVRLVYDDPRGLKLEQTLVSLKVR